MRHLIVPVVLGIGLATGCTAGGAGQIGSAPPEATAPDAVTLPVDTYRYTTWETGQVLLARDLLIRRCAGSAAEPGRIERTTLLRIRDIGPVGNKRRYGITSPSDAATYGYHLPSSVDSGIPAKSERSNPQCVQEADKALGDAALGTDKLVKTISTESYERSLADPRVTEAMRQWSTCMRDKNQPHGTPLDVTSAFDLDSATVSAEEIATATADVACKQSTGLTGTWQEVESALQRGMISARQAELRKVAEARQRVLARVTKTIEAGR